MSDGINDAYMWGASNGDDSVTSSSGMIVDNTKIPTDVNLVSEYQVKLQDNKSTVIKVEDEPAQGLKFDDGKSMLALVPPSLEEAVGAILTMGARKYSPNNWKKGIKYTRVVSALKRHLNAFYKGDLIDKESNLPHLWHAACNMAFLIEFESNPENYSEFDDIHKKDSK